MESQGAYHRDASFGEDEKEKRESLCVFHIHLIFHFIVPRNSYYDLTFFYFQIEFFEALFRLACF
jgi:hypothetical protein